MAEAFNKAIGRLQLTVSQDGYLQHTYRYGAQLRLPNGWEDPLIKFDLSVEELRDLQYLLSRALEGVGKPTP